MGKVLQRLVELHLDRPLNLFTKEMLGVWREVELKPGFLMLQLPEGKT